MRKITLPPRRFAGIVQGSQLDRRTSGFALVVVLSILVLLVSLVVAFMVSSRNDLNATTQYVAGEEARSLSETAVNLVMSQIREATLSGIGGSGQGTHAWASQPGALRVWDDSGTLVRLYKLYSAARMKEDDMSFLAGEIPSDWRKSPDTYVDLNEPVRKFDGTQSRWRYPILNPRAIGMVDGFSSSQTADPSIAWDTRTSMPVRWIYVNRDGSLSDTRGPDSTGRIAFWTDDETCKVNINTASASANDPTIRTMGGGMPANANLLGYSFWTPPHSRLMQDYNMGRTPLRQGEFQRYTSHPASVNLIGILKGPAFDGLTAVNKLSTLRDVFTLLPRYRWGGSENGRYLVFQNPAVDLTGRSTWKTERLFASVDELIFSATNRTPSTLPSPGPEASSLSPDERVDIWRSFLTVSSRAPDLNLFGQPRVCLWPLSLSDDINHRTVFDRWMARCATVGSSIFYFQRLWPFSQTMDWDNIPRNQQIFAMLRNLTSRRVPGFGGNFQSKYDSANGGVSGERDQILTAMFDYIRVVNLNETFAGRPAGFQSYTPDTPEVPPNTNPSLIEGFLAELENAGPGGKAGAGMVLPIKTPFGRGAGRVPVLSEAALFLMQRGEEEKDGSGNPTGNILPTNKVMSGLLFETFSPMQGFMPWTPRDFQMEVKTNATIEEGIPPMISLAEIFPGAHTGVLSPAFNRTTANLFFQPLGGTDGFVMPGPKFSNVTTYTFGRLFSQALNIQVPDVTLRGSSMSVSFSMQSQTYQTYDLDIPNASLPRPLPVFSGSNPNNSADWNLRRIANFHMGIFSNDVIHSLIPRDGDYRIIAYLDSVPHQFFRTHPDFGTATHFAHTLRMKTAYGFAGRDTNGTFVVNGGTDNGGLIGLPYLKILKPVNSNPSTIQTYYPDIPPDITDLVMSSGWQGDWDNGLGEIPDGAYLNKPDEGQSDIGRNTPVYFDTFEWTQANGFFSPTLAIPSAMMFGSIPSGVRRTYEAYRSNNFSAGRPWRTLLFCPNPDYKIMTGSEHEGANAPADSLLADLFNLPVVEPYAISEPLSTAGRINMNFQMLPFTTIRRTTALRAVLGGQKLPAIPNSLSLSYKDASAQNNATPVYHDIDPDETLEQFETTRFDKGEIFRSATEICSIFMIPRGVTFAGILDWWKDYRLTGDNQREKVYATMYPLLTTKSNTYTVHMRVQSLAPGTTKVTGEYRGSTTIERYVDPADKRIGTQIDPDAQSLEPLYRFRVVDTKRFAP